MKSSLLGLRNLRSYSSFFELLSLRERLASGGLILLAFLVVLPMAASAAGEIKLESNIGAANVTAGDTTFTQAVNAKYNEVVKVQVWSRIAEDPASDKIAQKVHLKITMPTTAGKEQSIKAVVKGDNTNTVEEQVALNLEREDASLQYIPGSAVWKHNTGSNKAVKFVEEKVSDEVINGVQGLALGDQRPGDNFASSVTVLARVMAPGVKVTKQVELKGESGNWSASDTAAAGSTLKYLVSYQNTGNTTQNKVIVRDSLPPHISLVPGTTKLTNTSNPNGKLLASDDIAKGGINIGNYGAGANAYVTFEATVDSADKLACGVNDLRNNSAVQPENMAEYFGTALTSVGRDCPVATPTPPAATPPTAPTPTPTPPATPAPAPVYSCDLLTVTKAGGRKITTKVDYTARDGAKLKTVTYNFGDGSKPLVTDKTSTDYTYPKDGSYTVTASLLMSVNGKDQTTTNAACSKPVSVAAGTSASPTPGKMPDTGPGDVVALFVAATIVGTLAHRLVLARRT